MISVVLILIFVFSLTSCSENEEIVPEKKQSSIVVKVLNFSVKSGEDEDETIIIIPKLFGKIEKNNGEPLSCANVKLFRIGSNEFLDETSTNINGEFVFYNIKKDTYEIIINSDGKNMGKKVIDL
jgi:hypothetical protein